MARRLYSAEEAYNILAGEESNGELSASDFSSFSDSESDVDYKPVLTSGTLTASEEENESPPARRRRTGEEAVPSTSTAVPFTSTAVPRQRPRTSGVSPQSQ
ncbi:hypothetical protein AB205_0006990, partial [Aquarana catesbeiana]